MRKDFLRVETTNKMHKKVIFSGYNYQLKIFLFKKHIHIKWSSNCKKLKIKYFYLHFENNSKFIFACCLQSLLRPWNQTPFPKNMLKSSFHWLTASVDLNVVANQTATDGTLSSPFVACESDLRYPTGTPPHGPHNPTSPHRSPWNVMLWW